jgi:polyvinyl alcohol dehydrogenase (cytochrome)
MFTAVAAVAAVLVIALDFVGVTIAAASPTTVTDSSSWTVYHHDPAGTGVAASVHEVDTTSRVWTSSVLDGQLYGEPLVSGGVVYVATEDDTVYALSASSGSVLWSTHLATPVPSSLLPCGDIQPLVGITGTPVIDPTRGEIFVVADELVAGKAAHVLIGLSTASGKLELTQNVDPPGADPAALLQRTGLTLDAGQVVFGMGGNYGDCSTYRGRVVAVAETGGTPTIFTVDAAAGDNQGAVWMGGAAPAVDASGDIWVSVGNGSVYSAADPYDDSDSVLELSPALQLLQYFAPTSWPQNNAHDLDMSMEPALLADGQVVLAGKSRIVYLLDGAHLGGIGGQEASLASGCDGDIDGGPAVVGTTVYLPCISGVIAVRAVESPAGLQTLWSSHIGGGPPIVAAGLIWTMGQNGVLYGLDPSTGAVVQQASLGVPANHFPTPSVGDGLLLAATADQVVAFGASSSGAPATTPPTTSAAPSRHRGTTPATVSGSGVSAGALAAIVIGALVVIGGVVWLLGRRRRADVPG